MGESKDGNTSALDWLDGKYLLHYLLTETMRNFEPLVRAYPVEKKDSADSQDLKMVFWTLS